MERDDHAEAFGPRVGESKPVKGAGPMEEHELGTLPGAEHHRVHPVEPIGLARELGHVRAYSAAARAGAVARIRGITFSASKLRFFTTFQCGMLPIAPRMLK